MSRNNWKSECCCCWSVIRLETHSLQWHKRYADDDRYNGLRKLRKGVQQVVIMHRMKRVKTQLASKFCHLSTGMEFLFPPWFTSLVACYPFIRFGKHCRPGGTRIFVKTCRRRSALIFLTEAWKCMQQFVPSFASADTLVCVGRSRRDTVSKGALLRDSLLPRSKQGSTSTRR